MVLPSAADQIFTCIEVSPLGDVHVVFHGRREGPDNYLLDIDYAYSWNGRDFDENWKIASDASLSCHRSGSVFMGDHIGIVSSAIYARAVWTDSRRGVADAEFDSR